MAITLNYTTIEDAESKDNWEVVGDSEAIDDSSYPPKQGDQCIQFELGPNKEGGVRNETAVSGYDCRVYETSVWFLNPVVDVDKKKVIDDTTDGLYIRLYSGSDYADFYQTQHRRTNGEWAGGWLYLKCSGEPGDEDANSGTWGADQCASIDKVAVMVNSGEGDTTDKDSAKFGVDWSKYYDNIVVTGDNDGVAWTLQDVFVTSEDKDAGGGVWGCVSNVSDFYGISTGLIFGDGDTGSFSLDNEYLLLDQYSDVQKLHIVVKSTFTLQVGVLSNGYTKNGCDITTLGKGNFTLENGGVLNVYASKLQGFKNVLLGDGNNDSTVVCLDSDLFNNDYIHYADDNTTFTGNRVYFSEGNEASAGKLDCDPEQFRDLQVFQSSEGIHFTRDYTMFEYDSGDNTYDVLVDDGKAVSMVNSVFDSAKMKRVE